MSKFQIIILSIFIVFLIAGVVAFATFKSSGSSDELAPVTIWGTFPKDTFDTYVNEVNNTSVQQIRVTYVYKNPDEFSRDFISALARGQGPDAILIPPDALLPHQDKIVLLPYSILPRRSFQDSYIQEGNMYLYSDGFLALPFTIDPLVMYWNKDAFDAAGIATKPAYWEDFEGLHAKLTAKDKNGNIRKSALAMGDFSNVANAREILATLIMQSGNPITVRSSDGFVGSALRETGMPNAAPALELFTDAVNPASSAYSWNRSLPNSKTAFLSGMLVTYLGFASELSDLRDKNTNINFDVAAIPQFRKGAQKATYGRMFGFSLLRSSGNQNSAFQVISILTAPQHLSLLSKKLYAPSVRREIIAQGSNDPYITIFNEAALVSRSWFDADPALSRNLFKSMTDAVTSGSRGIPQALEDAHNQYDIILMRALE